LPPPEICGNRGRRQAVRPYDPPALIRSKALRHLPLDHQSRQSPLGSIVQPISAGAGVPPQCPPGSRVQPISAGANLGSCAQKPLVSIVQPIAAQIERIQADQPSPDPRVGVPAEAVAGTASSRAKTRGTKILKRAMRILPGAKRDAGPSGPREARRRNSPNFVAPGIMRHRWTVRGG
jgi:hypothetical protein